MPLLAAGTPATLVGLVAILLWSSLAVLAMHAQGIPPFELLAGSFGVAWVAGMLVLASRGRAGIAQLRQPAAPWLTATLGIFAYHALYFFALAAAPPAQASLINYLWPLLIVLFGAGRSGLQRNHLLGALAGLAGTALLLLSHPAATATHDPTTEGVPPGHVLASLLGDIPLPLLGNAAAFCCALVWAGYSIRNRRFAGTPSGMMVGVCGAVALAGAGFHAALEPWVTPTAAQCRAILLLGLGPVGLAFPAWDHATKHGNLPLLGALAYLAPLVSTLLLVADGSAAPSLSLAVALLLIVGGAGLAARPAPAGLRSQ